MPTHAALVDTGSLNSKRRGNQQLAGRQPCKLCILMGRTINTARHTLASCWANPQNPNHKPNIIRLRLLECCYSGTTIHPCMAELDKKVPKDMLLPEGAKPIRPRGAKPTGLATSRTKVQADQVQHFQKDLTALLANNNTNIGQAICTALKVNLDMVIEPPLRR